MVPGQFARGFSKGRGGRGSSVSNSNGPSRPHLTHFLCIPLITQISRSQLVESFERFKDVVADLNKTAFHASAAKPVVAIPASAIRPVDSLHFTLGVMSLQNEERLNGAINLLNELNMEDLLPSEEPPTPDTSPKGLSVSLLSLSSMHDSKDTSILYAEPRDSTNRLLAFSSRLQAIFQEAGFVIDDKRPLKLHATVFNTVYLKTGGRQKTRINAIPLLEECKDFVWAEDVAINRVAICRMGAKKTYNEKGELLSEKYEEVASIDLIPRISDL